MMLFSGLERAASSGLDVLGSDATIKDEDWKYAFGAHPDDALHKLCQVHMNECHRHAGGMRLTQRKSQMATF